MAIGKGNAGLFMAQNVEMLVNKTAGSTTAPDEEWINMRSVNYVKAHPKARTDHGGTRAYGFAAPDAEVSAVVSATEDQMDLIEEMSTRNGLGILPIHNWSFRGTSADLKRRTATFKGWMYAVGFSKPEGHQGSFAEISFTIQLESTRPAVGTSTPTTVTLPAGGTFGEDAGETGGDPEGLQTGPDEAPKGADGAEPAVKEE